MATTGTPCNTPQTSWPAWPDGRGPRKMRNRGVIEGRLGLDLAGKAAQPGAKNDPGMGLAAPMGVDYVGSLGDLCG